MTPATLDVTYDPYTDADLWTADAAVRQATLNVMYDPSTDILTVEGMRYAGEFFRNFAMLPVGRLLKIEDRSDDGTITMTDLGPDHVGSLIAANVQSRGIHEALAAIEREAERFLGARARSIKAFVAKARKLL